MVHDSAGWNQNLNRPAFLGALHSGVPPKAIDGDFVLTKLHWPAWGQGSAPGTGQIATHGGRRYGHDVRHRLRDP